MHQVIVYSLLCKELEDRSPKYPLSVSKNRGMSNPIYASLITKHNKLLYVDNSVAYYLVVFDRYKKRIASVVSSTILFIHHHIQEN
jgi:hypothetical protein